jgi:SAM-dependent methyltransferase
MDVRLALRRVLPAPIFFLVRSLPYRLLDLLQPPPAGEIIPPLRLQLDGPRGYDVFRRNGAEAFAFYKNEVGLGPEARMLDIGCGIGRKTLPLTKYLAGNSLYVGMDIDDREIKWCSRNITPSYPNFVFITLDIFNKFYNPFGRVMPDQLVLPFPDSSFDVVTLWSVFTHMFPKDVFHYLREAHRVLKPGGKFVASYYLINDHAKREVSAGKALWPANHYLPDQGCWTINPNIPEDMIGLEEGWLRSAYTEVGFAIDEPIRLGGWANRPVPAQYAHVNSQDIVIARKN